jgi:hypothetical protein
VAVAQLWIVRCQQISPYQYGIYNPSTHPSDNDSVNHVPIMSDTILAVLLTGCFTSVPTIISMIVNNRRERNRHRQDLSVQVALEIWRRWCEVTDTASQKTDWERKNDQILGRAISKDPKFSEILIAVRDVIKTID